MKLMYLLLLILPFVVSISSAFIEIEKSKEIKALPEVHGDKFYYFGFGSNLLEKRIHIQNPTAVKIGTGELKNYRLDFNYLSTRWNGAAATVVPHFNRTVLGTLWAIDLANIADIDDQEGVHLGIYEPKSLPITMMPSRKAIKARVYLLTDQPKTDFLTLLPADIPLERLPSKTYLQCMVKGAIESDLDSCYIEWLKSITHNGLVAEDMANLLELNDVELNT